MDIQRVQRAGASAPPPPKHIHAVLSWLEQHVRKPLEGSVFDKWVATPAKQYYMAAKRLE